LLISATQETSKERVKPNNKVEENNNKLPIKLNGTINIEDIYEPIKPPPSCGRKLTPGSKISENKVEPEITTNNQPKIFTPNNPV
jgi:hypothetical protein